MNTSHCKKYGEWIEDAALGALGPVRERELLAHAGECAACREAYQQARELLTLVDRGVGWLVSGEPSSHFAARLRARIAEPSIRRFAWLTGKPMVAMAVTVVILLVLVARQWRVAAPQEVAVNSQSLALAPEKLTTNPPSHPAAATGAYRSRPGSHVLGPVSARHRFSRHATPRRQPEILVPASQLAAVMELAKAIHSGRVDGTKLLAAEQRADAPLEIKPLEIAPLESAEQDSASDASESSRRD
jgi:Putative zinc-finger